MRRWSKRAGRAFRLVSRSTGTSWPMSAGTKSKPTCSKPEWCSRPPPPPTNRACDAHHHGQRLTGARGRLVQQPSNRLKHYAKTNQNRETKDLTPGQAAAFDLEGQRIALFNVEGTYYAIGDSCTHRGGPLSEGDVQGTKVTCPLARRGFRSENGRRLGAASAEGRSKLQSRGRKR